MKKKQYDILSFEMFKLW